MNYYWLDCPRCSCQVAVNTVESGGKILGSVRRWSADRSTNDGRKFEAPVGTPAVACVCGQELALPAKPSAVGAERDPNLRVTLT